MPKAYDVVVIGAGINGLVAANYLARSGLSVCVLEARDVVGGACVTEELIPGAKWSSCAFVQGLFRPEIGRELQLDRFGLQMYSPPVQGFSLFPDGDHMYLWKELHRTLQELEAKVPGEGQRFIDFGARFRRFGDIMRPWLFRPPPPLSEVAATFEATGEQDLLRDFVFTSVRDLLDRNFESEHLRGFFTFFGMVSIWGGPSMPTTSYVYGHHASGEFESTFGRWAFVRGGMGGLTGALADAARASGATIRTAAPVRRVAVKGGQAAGVVLDSGEEIAASRIVSNADPKRSLLQMVDASDLDPAFRTRVEGIDQRGSMARIHLLVDELPRYIGVTSPTPGPQNVGHQLLGAREEAFEKAWEAQRRGAFPDEFVIEAITQSVTDDTLAPPGRHTLTLGVQQLPITLADGTWDGLKEQWADRVVEDLCRYAPNIRNSVLERVVISPADLQNEYHLTGGNIFHAAMSLEQLFASRPLPELARYRTPIKGYYLCGAGMHPGGGVIGTPGRNAAMTLLADLRSPTKPDARSRTHGPPAGGRRRGFVDKVMGHSAGRSIAYRVSRSRILAPLSSIGTRRWCK